MCNIYIYEYVTYSDTWNIHMHRNPETLETLTTLGSLGTKLLLSSWLLGFSTRGERDTISTMLTVPSDPTTRGHPVVHNWAGLAKVRKINSLRPASDLSKLLFFKNHPKYSAHRFQAWRHTHPQSHLLSGVFIMTSVIVTSSPREREHLRSMCAPTRALSWTVLCLTKPKDKI